jgi:hypothetical protein
MKDKELSLRAEKLWDPRHGSGSLLCQIWTNDICGLGLCIRTIPNLAQSQLKVVNCFVLTSLNIEKKPSSENPFAALLIC